MPQQILFLPFGLLSLCDLSLSLLGKLYISSTVFGINSLKRCPSPHPNLGILLRY